MGLAAVTETAQMFQQKNIVLTERDKEFVVQFAFRTNDKELTNKLIDELTEAGADMPLLHFVFIDCDVYDLFHLFCRDFIVYQHKQLLL